MEPGNLPNHTVPAVGADQPASARLSGWAFNSGALLILTVVSLAAGCLVNMLRTDPLPWVYASRARAMAATVASLSTGPSAPVELKPPQEIELEAFQAFVAEHKGLVLDARPKVFYDLGHVPGAVSLPREAFAQEYPAMRGKLDAHKDLPVAVYCSGADCPDSELLADALTKLGYHHLLIYTSGWEEWSQTGLPQEGSAAQP